MKRFQTLVQISIIDKRNTAYKIMFGVNNFQRNIEAIFKNFFLFFRFIQPQRNMRVYKF